MPLPEITALCRVLARSDAQDVCQQGYNLARLRELKTYLQDHADLRASDCLEAVDVLLQSLSANRRIERSEILRVVCMLLGTVDKHWCGSDPDAALAETLYEAPQDSETAPDALDGPTLRRTIESSVHAAHTLIFGDGDVAEAQSRIDRLKSTPRISDMVLGELLVEMGHLLPEDLHAALEQQEKSGELLGAVLAQRGLVESRVVEETADLQRQLRGECTRSAFFAPEPPAPPPPPKKAPRPRPVGVSLEMDEPGLRRAEERGRDHLLGQILMRQGAIDSTQLEAALSVQRASGLRLGETLVEMQATTWEVVNRAADLQRRLREVAGVSAWG